jgi:hypothetical protein
MDDKKSKSIKGGKREGAGRPTGASNKVTIEVKQAIAAFTSANADKLDSWLEYFANESFFARFIAGCSGYLCDPQFENNAFILRDRLNDKENFYLIFSRGIFSKRISEEWFMTKVTNLYNTAFFGRPADLKSYLSRCEPKAANETWFYDQ